MHTHLPRDVGGEHVAVVQLDAEHRVGQRLDNRPVPFNSSLFCHRVLIVYCLFDDTEVRQDIGSRFADRNGELVVRRRFVVPRADRPAIPFENHRFGPHVDHGFDADDHSLLEERSSAAGAVVRNTGVFVHLPTQTVSLQLAHHAVAEALGVFLHAELMPGIEIVMEETRLEEKIKNADFVVTGEGRLDAQTAMGKAPVGVAKFAKKYHKPVIAFAGGIEKGAEACNKAGITAFFPAVRGVTTLDEAMRPETAAENLAESAEQVFRLLTLR